MQRIAFASLALLTMGAFAQDKKAENVEKFERAATLVTIKANLPVSCISVQTYPVNQPGLWGIAMSNNCGQKAHVLWNVFDYNGGATDFAGWWCNMEVNENRSAYFHVRGRGESPRLLMVKTADERCPQ